MSAPTPPGSAHIADTARYVYGWGRTKHLPGPPPSSACAESPGTQGVDWALCGVEGGNQYERPSLPVCKHCQRLAAKAAHIVGPND